MKACINNELESDVSDHIGIQLGLKTEISPALRVLTGIVLSAEYTTTAFHIRADCHKESNFKQIGVTQLNVQRFVVGQFIARFYIKNMSGDVQGSERPAGRAINCATTN